MKTWYSRILIMPFLPKFSERMNFFHSLGKQTSSGYFKFSGSIEDASGGKDFGNHRQYFDGGS